MSDITTTQPNDKLHNLVNEKPKTCPKCRGYSLEKSWCDVCKKTGFVNDKDERRR